MHMVGTAWQHMVTARGTYDSSAAGLALTLTLTSVWCVKLRRPRVGVVTSWQHTSLRCVGLG